MQVKKSSKPKGASFEQDNQKSDPDLFFYREVDISDLSSQYTEDKHFRQILNLPDPRGDSMLRSSITVWALNDAKGQQELGQQAKLPFSYARSVLI